MPGLRRDVLCWLVALNLSFPIKNIKRFFTYLMDVCLLRVIYVCILKNTPTNVKNIFFLHEHVHVFHVDSLYKWWAWLYDKITIRNEFSFRWRYIFETNSFIGSIKLCKHAKHAKHANYVIQMHINTKEITSISFFLIPFVKGSIKRTHEYSLYHNKVY
jgi:hypothetical protein